MTEEKLYDNQEMLELEEAVRKLDNYFLLNNERRLHDFIVSAVEKPLIERVLKRTGGNQSKTAEILGINRNTLHTKIKKLDIDIDRWKNF